MAQNFVPETALESAVYAGDYPQTLTLLRILDREQRRAHRSSVRRMQKLLDAARWNSRDENYAGWGVSPTDDQVRAMFATVVVCGTAADVAASHGSKDDLLDLCREFGPESLQGMADAQLRGSPHAIGVVQALLVAGLVPRPDSDDYIIGLMSLAQNRRFEAVWAADPGLREVLLRIMEVEGSSEFNLAAVDKYTHGTACWSQVLCRLRDEGVYTQEQLMERTLSTLAQDWPQFRAGWFSRFHAELAPDLPLLAANAPRYLGLCHSRIAPTVTMALEVIKRLEPSQVIADADLFDALRPVLHASTKAQVLGALKLLDGRVKRDSALAESAFGLAMVALAHTAPDVQAQVLQRLARWHAGPDVRMLLPLYADGIAAVHRPAFLALMGGAAADAAGPSLVEQPVVAPGSGPACPLDEAHRLRPPADIDALVRCVAHVFENDHDSDAFEMAAATLVQLAPLEAGQRERLGPVIKRAGRLRTPVAQELGRLLLAVVGERGELLAPRPFEVYADTALACLQDRSEDWLRLAAQAVHLPPLSMPTHRGGFIAPSMLVERAAAYEQRAVDVGLREQVRALLRLAPIGDAAAIEAARQLADGPFTRALRYALGDDLAPETGQLALFAAAARVRFPEADDPALFAAVGDIGAGGAHAARYRWQTQSWQSEVQGKTYHHHGFIVEVDTKPNEVADELLAVRRHRIPREEDRGYYVFHAPGFAGHHDEGLLRFSAVLLPNCLEAHFADGVRAIGNNLDWWEAQWSTKAYLERLLDPAVTMRPMATLLLALGLAAKEPGQHALSVDALLATWREGRLETDALAIALRRLTATPMVKASRYTRSLQQALRLDPGAHPLVFDLLVALVTAVPDAPQRDIAGLLELMLELSLAHGHRLRDAERAMLQAMPLKAKAGQLARTLLAA